MIEIKEAKDKVAIVVVGYNRLNSLKRLMKSLLQARYPNVSIPLVISIDCSNDIDVYNYARDLEWPYGDKYVNIQTERLGLKNHIFQCGDLTKYFKGIILLEDDVYVSEFFYSYTVQAVDYYYNDDRIAAISLYRNEMIGLVMMPIISMQDGKDVFLKQTIASWGQCWTDRMWASFRKWYDNSDRENFASVDMPEACKKWQKAWSKYYMSYEVQTGKFCLFPSISLTTCFCEAGENGEFTTSIGQVNLLSGEKNYTFYPFEQLTKYDAYSSNLLISEWLGIDNSELCVNLYGFNPNRDNKRYELTPFKKDYKAIESFALALYPIELNVKHHLSGNGIYLYDTSIVERKNKSSEIPISFAHYYLRMFNIKLLGRYMYTFYKQAIKRKIKRRLHIK